MTAQIQSQAVPAGSQTPEWDPAPSDSPQRRAWTESGAFFDSLLVGLIQAPPDWHKLKDGDFGIFKTSSFYN